MTTPPVAAPVAPLFTRLTPLPPAMPLRRAISDAWRLPEPQIVPGLLQQARLPEPLAQRARQLATRLVEELRQRRPASGKAGRVQALLQAYALSSQEGIALMCLAEALLRIPDSASRDALIRDKISRGDWQAHMGSSPSPFVNATTWGLMLTGKLLAAPDGTGLSAALTRLIARGGEPLIRKGVDMAMRMLGEQFVAGEDIASALAHARPREAEGFRYSYDMLGEAALTAADAQRYRKDYEQAIHAIGRAAQGRGVYKGPGISIKLSALHPRYSRAQVERVQQELYPVLRQLALLARHYDIGLNIDAEESDRLELSLDLLEQLCAEPGLAGWNGIGFVVQAYQKRCPLVINFLIDLARRSGRRLMVRLVKGAYWDSEIKRAQADGFDGFPVYTRKPYTDLSYIGCARRLLAAPDAIYPQFASHNAQTLASIYELADPARYRDGQYEFQCLHGMGESLYTQVVASGADGLSRPCRIYAPVGSHETLLAYLVRRLLENGANTSFVNQVADPNHPVAQLVADPVTLVEALAAREGQVGLPHPGIAAPAALYGATRQNSAGLDLACDPQLTALQQALRQHASGLFEAAPMLAPDATAPSTEMPQAVLNPADHADQVGWVRAASSTEIDAALRAAQAGAPAWADTPVSARAAMLRRAADALQHQMQPLIGLLVREAGKTCANAIAEVREAIDFLRYYAAQAEASFDAHSHRPLGPVVCISPWNFPLAIFTGQIAAALATGNSVLAKPAEQTPLVAAQAVALLHAAGVPRAALQLLPGDGEQVGARLVADPRVMGVMFTGSTEVARLLQQALARRLTDAGQPVPLIAETGGQNAMIVDSSALTEQVVVDVLSSAFDSAGQRCSALRVLCVQEEAADRLLTMLKGAMSELSLGDPQLLAHDVGPVIDAEAQAGIQRHIEALRAKTRPVHQLCRNADASLDRGTFVPPTLIELERLDELKREVFGPVLHVLRYQRHELPQLLTQINATGYGLTMGLHTRIDETIDQVVAHAAAGNLYVNRNIVGAVVGVQPFGGEGLSGTGPKAGGPLYLYRLLSRRPIDAAQPLPALFGALPSGTPEPTPAAVLTLRAWLREQGLDDGIVPSILPSGRHFGLPGPTGEDNRYTLLPRAEVLCLAQSRGDLLIQLAALLAIGSRAVWPAQSTVASELYAALPATVQAAITLVQQPASATFDAVLYHGETAGLPPLLAELAQRPGPIVGVTALPPGCRELPLERLLVERALSVNTAAAGGNATLMMLD